MEQEAWLASCPEKLGGWSRAQFIGQAQGQQRLSEFIVDPGPLHWLIDLVNDAGPCGVEYTLDGAVLRGLSWADMRDWAEGSNSGHIGPNWRRDMMLLSQRFAQMAQAAQKNLEQAVPYQPGQKGGLI